MDGTTFFFGWEVALMEWLQAHAGSFGESLAWFFSLFGDELMLVAIVGFLYWCYNKEFGKFVCLNLAVACCSYPMLKNIFFRRRPYFDHETIRCVHPAVSDADPYNLQLQGYSFPSGHAANASSTYGAIAAFQKKKGWLIAAILLTFFVGLSRPVLGVHYPTDVLAGWAVGLLDLALVSFLLKKIRSRGVVLLILAVIFFPGIFYCKSSDYFTAYGLLLGFSFGFLFEEKYVRFENTRSVVRCVLREAFGIGLFLGLNAVLKLPFSGEFLDSGTMAANLVRLARYCIVVFVVAAPYPMLFRYTAKIGKKA